VIRFRPFRNSDPPALVKLWNQGVPERAAVRPLRVHELDDRVFGQVYFDRAGLIVAERDDRVVGFAHAGFGPDQPIELMPPFSFCESVGTVAMLVVEPGVDCDEVASGLIIEAERYLRRRGTKVIYAGGQYPLNPFYWGLYGGSEGSGIVPSHPCFPQVLARMGYEPVSSTVLFEYDLGDQAPRDPRAVLIRRQTELEQEEDAMPHDWWENLAVGEFHLTRFRLLARSGGDELARALTWDMSWFGRADGLSRVGLFGVEVAAGHRRQGFGRFLVSEILRLAREETTALVEVQTMATNAPALALYDSLGFRPIDESSLYRLPAHLLDRQGVP
jgi:ribosomal protein S18 acetylase RimI-like enzyme